MALARWILLVLLAFVAGAWLFSVWQSRVIARRYAPTGIFVATQHGRIHLTERRPQGKPRQTVVLLHGASGNQADMMLPLGDRLAALGFRVIALDRPGHGWSERPDGAAEAAPDRQADVLREALIAIGITHAIVVGHSWSGTLAADFALQYPDFTEGLVLLSPVLYPWTTGIAWYNGVVMTPVLGDLFAQTLTLPAGLLLLPAGVAEVFSPQPAPADFVARTGVELVLRPAEFVANAQDVSGLLAFVTGQAPHLKDIRVPTAIVSGDGDRVVSPEIHARHGAREIPGATLTMLPGVGHSPHWADPDAVVAAILSVADRIDAGQHALWRASAPPAP